MRTLYLLAIGLFMTCMIACTDDDNNQSDCNRLEGNWTGISWMEDGNQLLGDSILISTSTVAFGEMDGDEGSVDWNTNYIIVADERFLGTYRVNDQCDEVTFSDTGGASIKYAYRFDGNVLVLERNSGGIQTTIRFNKS